MFHSKIRVYTNGLVDEGIGAYAYIVLENRGEDPTILRAKFAQAGKCEDSTRMKMRAVYEGLRHCPDGVEMEVYTDHFLIKDILETTKETEEDGDIAVRYRSYIAEHQIRPEFLITKFYNGKDLPDNDHDEWTWWAHNLCENAIRKFRKENK